MTAARTAQFTSSHEWSIVRRVFPAGSRLLDAGCGFGEWVYVLASHGYDAIGVDYSGELVERLRAAYPESTWLQSDIRSMSIPDNHVDGVISWGVIEHDEAGPAAALREFFRIVKPGGAIIVTVPRDSAQQRKSSRVQFPETDTMAFFQYFMTEEELGQHVRDAAFQVEETGSLAHSSFALFAPKVYSRASGLPLRIANRAGAMLLKPFEGYRGMNYAVGRKPIAP